MVMTYSSSLPRNSSLALPSRIADKELPGTAEASTSSEFKVVLFSAALVCLYRYLLSGFYLHESHIAMTNRQAVIL